MNPHHLDARDAVAPVGGVITLAPAQRGQALGTQAFHRVVRAAGLLPVGTHRAHAKARLTRHADTAAHGSQRLQQIEPEQNARPAGAVDLPAFERLPDGAATPAFGVYRHQAAREPEGGHALGAPHTQAPLGIEGPGARRRRGREPLEKPPQPRIGNAPLVGHGGAGELLVAGAGARGVVVAGGDESEAEALPFPPHGQRRLHRHAGPVLEGRQEAISTLSGVEPVLDRLSGHGLDPVASGLHVELTRLGRTAIALGLVAATRLGARAQAAVSDDLAGALAVVQVIGPGLRADGGAIRAVLDSAPVAVFLGVAVARVDLDQPLPIGVVIALSKLPIPAYAGRCRGAPGGAVGNYDRRVAPVVELFEQLARRVGALDAVVGKLAHASVGAALGDRNRLAQERVEIEIALAILEVEKRDHQAGQPHVGTAKGLVGGAARGDRAAGELVFGRLPHDHVLVSVVGLRGIAHLGPLPADEGHQIRARGVTRDLVALADAVLELAPPTRRQALGVVVDGPEIESGAEAREVAGVGRRVRALPLHQRQAPDEGVTREGGVDVEITEQDLPGRGGTGAVGPLRQNPRGQAPRRHLTGMLRVAKQPEPQGTEIDGRQGHGDAHDHRKALDQVSHEDTHVATATDNRTRGRLFSAGGGGSP